MRMGATMGGIWIAMRVAMASPLTPDCRGGVFAVFAKIPPPTCPPYARTLSAFSLPCGALPHGVMLARAVFVATWRDAFLTPRRAPKTPRCDKNRASPRVVCAYTYNGRWAGESSRCEDPAPTVGIAGRRLRGMPHRPSFAPTWASTGTANGRLTTRRAASLRPSRNGRIGFKPPYSKREPRRRPVWVRSL